MAGFLIAVISGALMSIQGVFNAGVTKQTGVWTTAAFVQLSAFIVCVAAWFFSGKETSFAEIFKIDNKYMLLGGIIGAFITFTVIKSVESLGAAKSAMFIVAAQLLTAYIIELFGLFGMEKAEFSFRKLIGFVITVAGILIFKWE